MMMSNNNKPTLKKTTTFSPKKSDSMQIPTAHHQPMEFVPKRCASLKFPASPQLVLGEEMLHFSHPQHPLSHVNLPDLFTCAGCKEYGAGKRYTCQQCDYQLHDFCASAPPVLKSHPFHCQHQLAFYSKPVKGGIAQSKCDVCSKPIKGYAFRCGAGCFQMHPCCAMLSSEISLPYLHPHTLRLLPALKSGSDPSFVCGECRRKRSGTRVYHCTVCDYHLHAVCAKNMINGLQENGIKNLEKPSMLGTAARLASQVVIEFLGGLMEGLGEGVAEVFVQNVTRSGRGNGRGRNPTP
ncbi:uncharacterized protein LOC112178881 [Rosa chinensis]|nr:uncharacterized protein LOC112178881 [Rosa chinensis]